MAKVAAHITAMLGGVVYWDKCTFYHRAAPRAPLPSFSDVRLYILQNVECTISPHSASQMYNGLLAVYKQTKGEATILLKSNKSLSCIKPLKAETQAYLGMGTLY